MTTHTRAPWPVRWLTGLLLGLAAPAAAQDAPPAPGAEIPEHQLPADVLAGLRLVEDRFTEALAQDCDAERCYAQGCAYVSHEVVDRPAVTSLPGLGRAPGPSGGPRQVYLTRVACGFAYEPSVSARDAKALAKRLEAKLSKGWTKVQVSSERLSPVSQGLSEPPEPPPPPPEPAPAAPQAPASAPASAPEPPWDAAAATRELWLSLLPHFPWMLGLAFATLAALLLIWAARRLGRISPEEQALLARMTAEDAPPEAPAAEGPTREAPAELDAARLTAQRDAWRARLAQADAEADAALQVLVADLLRAGERRLLAKAVVLFPEAFPRAFPQHGAFASEKYALAEYLKHVDPASLPGDAELFDKLDRYAMAAALTAHPDTELIRSLHADFGPAALVDAVRRLAPRPAALLFAVAPEGMQREAVRQLDPERLAGLADQLLRSNRMDPAENDFLLRALAHLRAGQPLPSPPERQTVSDRGTAFDAPGALSKLLPALEPATRAALIDAARQRHGGHLPRWTDALLYGDMLLRLPEEPLRDLLLSVPLEPLAAWLRAQPEATAEALRARAPSALRAALGSLAPPASPGAAEALANDARLALQAGLTARLARQGTPLHALLA